MERKGMSQGAFGTDLTCPSLVSGIGGKAEVCSANKWEFVQKLGPYRIRYRCKACKNTLIYEFTNNPGHPYEGFGKTKWQRVVDHWKTSKKGPHPLN